MSGVEFSLIAVAVTVLSLASFVFRRNPREALTRAFVYFLIWGSAWGLSIAYVIHAPSLPHLVPVGHAAFAAGILAISGFFAFVLIFPSPRIPAQRWAGVWAVYGLGVLVALLALTPAIFAGPDFATTPPRPRHGPLFPLYTLAALGCTAGAMTDLVLKFRRTTDPRERVQLWYLIGGGLLSVVTSVTLVLVLPAIGITGPSTLAPLSALGMIMGAALAITKHRLFNLGVVFRHTLIAVGVTLSLALLILGMLEATQFLFGTDPTLMKLGLLATAMVVGILFPIIRHTIESGVDQYVFGGPPTDTAALRALSQELTTMLSVQPLADLLVSGLGRALRLRHVTLYLADPDERDATVAWQRHAAWPEDHPATPDLPADSPVLAFAAAKREPLVLDWIGSEAEHIRRNVREWQSRLGADVVVPLAVEQEVLGLLVLSEKFSGDLLSEQELALLSTLAHQASTALANAMLHEEIVRMKVHNDNVLRGMVSGVIAVDSRGRLTTCNRRAAELLGRAPGDLIGEDEAVLPDSIAGPLRDARYQGGTVRLLRADLPRTGGGSYTLSLLANVLQDAQGHTIGALIVFEDQTERLRLEEGLQRADRLASLGTLAAGLAHEIKNPLVSIRTLAQLLPTKFNDPEFRDTFAQLAGGEVERINDLVERLLVFARPSPPSPQWLHTEPIVEDVLHLMGAELDAHGVLVERAYGKPEALVYADPAQLRQVFLNLFMNALDAMRDSAERRLRVAITSGPPANPALCTPDHWVHNAPEAPPGGRPGQLTLIVSDTGVGILDEFREEIFNPFFTTKVQGSGLGLAVVARIIREHGGTISANAATAGGASLVIHFPAHIPVPSPAPVS